ncbi:MAG: ATP cone domain-containing protein [Clostridiaceae bacterium]
MITVIKRRGNKQDFDLEKIMISIASTADEAGIHMTNKETKLVAEDVKSKIIRLRGENAETSALELRSLVGTALCEAGFDKVSYVYNRGKVSCPRDLERHVDAVKEHLQAISEITDKETALMELEKIYSSKTELFKKDRL